MRYEGEPGVPGLIQGSINQRFADELPLFLAFLEEKKSEEVAAALSFFYPMPMPLLHHRPSRYLR